MPHLPRASPWLSHNHLAMCCQHGGVFIRHDVVRDTRPCEVRPRIGQTFPQRVGVSPIDRPRRQASVDIVIRDMQHGELFVDVSTELQKQSNRGNIAGTPETRTRQTSPILRQWMVASCVGSTGNLAHRRSRFDLHAGEALVGSCNTEARPINPHDLAGPYTFSLQTKLRSLFLDVAKPSPEAWKYSQTAFKISGN